MQNTIQSPCAKCPLRRDQHINRELLDEFICDCLTMSIAHYNLISKILSPEDQIRYELKHLQGKMLLGLLRNT